MLFDDVVLIHSTRPELLFEQVKSFLDNINLFCMGGRTTLPELEEKLDHKLRNILFVCISDINDIRYNIAKNKIKRYISKLGLVKYCKFDLWDLKRQISFFNNLAIKINKQNNYSKKRILDVFRDLNSNKLGGLRGIQNKSVIIADYLTSDQIKDKPPIYHKLDDDIFAYIATKSNKNLQIIQGYDIFNHKSKALSNKKVRIIGSRYCVDSPSFIVDLYAGVYALKTFFESSKKIKSYKNVKSWKKMLDNLGCSINLFYDESGLIETKESPILYKQDNLAEFFKKIAILTSLLQKENNRLTFSVLQSMSPSLYGFKDALEGGFVSFKATEEIIPYPRYGNQDLLFSVFEHALHGGVKGDWPVAHIKKHRSETVIGGIEYSKKQLGYRKNDFLTTNYIILKLAKDGGYQISKGLRDKATINRVLNFITPYKIFKNLDSIEENLKNKKMWWNNKEFNLELKVIKNFVSNLKQSRLKINKAYDYANTPKKVIHIADITYRLWKEDLTLWPLIRKNARLLPLNF